MLYISRFVGEEGIGVVDTDDGVEQIVLYKDIVDTSRLGIDIGGLEVDVVKRAKDIGNWVYGLDVWKGLSVKSTYASKLAGIHGIDVRCYNGYISAIRWSSDRLKFPVDLKLSDFGSFVGDKLLFDTGVKIGSRVQLRLIFDDSLEVGHHIFEAPTCWGVGNTLSGVTLDIRGLRNTDKVASIYQQLRRDPAFYRADGSSLILDDAERQMWYRGYR